MIICQIDCPKCNNKIDVFLNSDLGHVASCIDCNIDIFFWDKRRENYLINYNRFAIGAYGEIYNYYVYYFYVDGIAFGINYPLTNVKGIISGPIKLFSSYKEAFLYLSKYIDNLVFA